MFSGGVVLNSNKKIKKNGKSVGLILLIVAVVLAVVLTFSWFYNNFGGIIYNALGISNFNTSADIYFESDSGTRTEVNSYVNGDKTFTVDVSDESSPNYIGNLHVKALYKGRGYGYLRMRIIPSSEYVKSGVTHIAQLDSPLPMIMSKSSKEIWFDNSNLDGFFYYSSPINSVSNNSYKIIDFLDGIDMNVFEAVESYSGSVKISVEVDAVQINRYKQFWGIEELPWN